MRSRNAINLMLALTVTSIGGGVGLIPEGYGAKRGEEYEPEKILPPKKVFTKEQESILNNLYLNKSPEGLKICKKYLKEIENVK